MNWNSEHMNAIKKTYADDLSRSVSKYRVSVRNEGDFVPYFVRAANAEHDEFVAEYLMDEPPLDFVVGYLVYDGVVAEVWVNASGEMVFYIMDGRFEGQYVVDCDEELEGFHAAMVDTIECYL